MGGHVIGRQHDMDMVSAARRGLSRRAEADTPTDAISAIVAGCENCLRDAGIIGALRFLNGRTRYRYTGLYRAEPPLLRNVQLFDRENPTLNVSGEVKPLQQTYCGIVQETNDKLQIADALEDAHLAAHPAREAVLSYCGVPIRVENGLPWGTLCHYDVRPRLLSAQESRILEAAAPLFARWLIDQNS